LLIGFWLLVFGCFRLLFLWWNAHLLPKPSTTSHWLNCIWAALPLDLSVVGYFLALPILLTAIGDWLSETWSQKMNWLITKFFQFLSIPVVLICLANLVVYTDWQTLLNRRALAYLSEPMGMINSLTMAGWFGAVAAIFLASWLLVRSLSATFLSAPERLKGISRLLWPIVAIPLVALMIRGGIGPMPINESNAYHSEHLIFNHAATNPVWHLIHTLVERRSTTNLFQVQNADAAITETKVLLSPISSDSSLLLTDTNRFNIVLVMMESMTAQVVEAVGGLPGVTPVLNRLAKQGLVFDSIYSTGYRTDQGLAAILSGYPAQPDQSAILHDDKMRKLPSLPAQLKKLGYQTHAWYGGELNFANMGAYFYHLGFDMITSQGDFPKGTPTQNWGIPDHLLFKEVNSSLAKKPQPFFAFVQTLSLHKPYDTPGNTLSESAPLADRFLACATYADSAIGAFIDEAATQPWYANTLFVFVADHGVSEPGNLGPDMPMARKVPLIFYGPALAKSSLGKRSHQIGNHHDIPATLCQALGIESQSFKWSRSLLQTYRYPFAMYCNESGAGWLSPQAVGFYRINDGFWYPPYGALPDDTTKQRAVHYFYSQYSDYLDL
jgi:phosphoglycerol transferase MdoB-like AlkP superfamily enzyme